MSHTFQATKLNLLFKNIEGVEKIILNNYITTAAKSTVFSFETPIFEFHKFLKYSVILLHFGSLMKNSLVNFKI